MADRANLQSFKGNPLTLSGTGSATVGQKAPDFTALKNLLESARLSDYAGKTVILNAVPSLDTPVCSMQAAKFNKEAAGLANTVVLVLSMDLPFAQSRWCGANDAKNIVTLSDFKDRDFANKFGLLIKENGLIARAVYVIDANGVVTYEEIVKELASEPNYDAALAAAKV